MKESEKERETEKERERERERVILSKNQSVHTLKSMNSSENCVFIMFY